MSPAKDNGYKGQQDTTQSNLARVENGTLYEGQHITIARMADSFVVVLYIHMPGALCIRKRHLRWAMLAAGTLVSPLSQKESISSRTPGEKLQPVSLSPTLVQLTVV